MNFTITRNATLAAVVGFLLAAAFFSSCGGSASEQGASASADAKAAGTAVVSALTYPDVRSAPDKYVGRKVAWIGAEALSIITDANGNLLRREFVWRDENRQLAIQNSFWVLAADLRETEAAKNSKGDFIVSGTIKEIARVAAENGPFFFRPALVVPVLSEATVDVAPPGEVKK